MATRNIPGATISDIEATLIEQYGRTNIREKAKSDTHTEWTFRISSKSQGKCTATKSEDGVNLAMTPSTHILLWVMTGIGYFIFIFPGVIMTVYILFNRFVTARVLNYRFQTMFDNVQRVAASRTGQRLA